MEDFCLSHFETDEEHDPLYFRCDFKERFGIIGPEEMNILERFHIQTGENSKMELEWSTSRLVSVISRPNCKSLIISSDGGIQDKGTSRERKRIYIRAVMSPVLNEEFFKARFGRNEHYNFKYIKKYNFYDFYSRKSLSPVKIWTPSFVEIATLLYNDDANLHCELVKELAKLLNHNKKLNPVKFVEQYLINRNENWILATEKVDIEYYEDDRYVKYFSYSDTYHYDIDCRLLYTLLKEIMIIEDIRYPTGKGKMYFVEAFTDLVTSNISIDEWSKKYKLQ